MYISISESDENYFMMYSFASIVLSSGAYCPSLLKIGILC